MTIVDELLREGASARPSRPPPAQSGPGEGSDPSRRETGGGQRRVRCPSCGFEQSGDPSSCRRCGNRLREPSRATRVAAVLGESDDGDVLEALGLDEDDLRESLDPADAAPPRSTPPSGGRFDRHARERIRIAVENGRAARDEGKSAEDVARYAAPVCVTEAELQEALRQVGPLSDGDDRSGDEVGDGAVTLEDGLDDWLDDRFGGSA